MSHEIDQIIEEKGNEQITAYFQFLVFLNESTNDYLFLWDLETERIYFAKDISRSYKLPSGIKHSCSPEDWMSVVYPRDAQGLSRQLTEIRQGRIESYDMEYRVMDRDGDFTWVSCRGKVMFDQEQNPLVMLGCLSHQALEGKIDPLTRLFNGSKLHSDLKSALERNQQGILLLFDIDNFKHINTQHGRTFGNTLLCKSAALLEDCLDPRFRVYRLQGDLFAANMTASNREEVHTLYNQVREKMPEHCTVSAGAAQYPDASVQDASILFSYAEHALSVAKQEGKNRLCFFSLEQYEKQLYLIDLTEELQRSMEDNLRGFSLQYLPLVSAETGEVVSAEVLLRYHSAYHGIISPDVFMPILERTGMILPVGDWILKEAIFQCKKWRMHRPDFGISVNLSYAQLQNRSLSDHLFSLLQQADLPHSALTLELTESMHLQDYTSLRRLFVPHNGENIRISIDDFGTGYSSLSYLKDLSIDEIKIDRSFINYIHLSAYNYHLLRNISELARNAEIDMCCEGVETAEELHTLCHMKPQTLQGYYFSKPLPPAQFEKQFILSHQKEAKWKAEIRAGVTGHGVDSNGSHSPEALSLKDADYRIILDQLEEVVYLSDTESHELYYMNLAGQKMTGISDYQGKKCYKVLQGKNDPCEFCTNSELRSNSFLTYTLDNQHLNRRLLEKCKLFDWNGKSVRLEVESNLSAIDGMLEDMENKLAIEKSLVEALADLHTIPDPYLSIQRLLKHTAAFYQAERCHIFVHSQTENTWNNLYEWCQHQIESQQMNQLSISDQWLLPWMKDFNQGKPIVIKDIGIYRDTNPHLYEILNSRNVNRLLLAPIMNRRAVIGFIGVDNPKHLPYNERFLSQSARAAVSLLARNGMLGSKEELLAEMTNMLRGEEILKSTGLGLWTVELDRNAGISRMFVDENMNNILGVSGTLNSVEYYQHWYENINDGYYNYVNNAIEEMVSTGKTISLEYTWNHPVQGEVPVHCVGRLSKAADGVFILKGYHRIANDLVQKRFIDEENYEMFEYNEVKRSIYFHTSRSLIKGQALKETDFPNGWVDEGIVHSYFISDFRKLLTFVKGHSGKQSLDLLLKNKKDEYEWFRMETHRIGHTKHDVNTLIISLHPIMEDQPAQMQYIRKDDYYHAILSETVAYMELDLDSQLIENSGGLWESYKDEMSELKERGAEFRTLVHHHLDTSVSEEDREACAYQLDPAVMKENFKQGQTATTLQFRRCLEGSVYHWMELNIHVFQEQVTQNMYALLYLKDIDTPKRRQLEQEKAANHDSLTSVLNRAAMKEAVTQYMNTSAEDDAAYAFMLFDLDNFKQINDTQGHQMGDAALKIFVATLKDTFRTSDFIGRLGGDEFLVFLTRELSPDTLGRRLTRMQEKLQHNKMIPLSCSIGVHLLRKADFDYDGGLKKADQALYKSKEKGKGTYSYCE